jgi:hypothetical protein
VKEYYDSLSIVWIHSVKCTGIVEKMGAYASKIKYTLDEVEHEDFFDNDDFFVLEEITFHHIEEN